MLKGEIIILKFLLLFIALILGNAWGISVFSMNSTVEDLILQSDLKDGEALIWYLGHAGWAVKTKNHFLVFDYVSKSRFAQQPQNLSLSNGCINPSEIKNYNVFVFVSHGHLDHYDPVIFEWEESIKSITYIFGWKADRNPRYLYFTEPRTRKTVDGLEVLTINHDFDGIPEVAYLVKVDGLVIFHSGDHGSTGEKLNPIFKDNIDYLSQQARDIDIAFVSQFGSGTSDGVNNGDLYTISKLGPKVIFPMHKGGGERFYKEFAVEAKQKGVQTEISCAQKNGDRFFYQKGNSNET